MAEYEIQLTGKNWRQWVNDTAKVGLTWPNTKPYKGKWKSTSRATDLNDVGDNAVWKWDENTQRVSLTEVWKEGGVGEVTVLELNGVTQFPFREKDSGKGTLKAPNATRSDAEISWRYMHKP